MRSKFGDERRDPLPERRHLLPLCRLAYAFRPDATRVPEIGDPNHERGPIGLDKPRPIAENFKEGDLEVLEPEAFQVPPGAERSSRNAGGWRTDDGVCRRCRHLGRETERMARGPARRPCSASHRDLADDVIDSGSSGAESRRDALPVEPPSDPQEAFLVRGKPGKVGLDRGSSPLEVGGPEEGPRTGPSDPLADSGSHGTHCKEIVSRTLQSVNGILPWDAGSDS